MNKCNKCRKLLASGMYCFDCKDLIEMKRDEMIPEHSINSNQSNLVFFSAMERTG